MRRLLCSLAPLVASLALAPAALATTYVVDDPGDGHDALPGDDHCDVDAGTLGDQCSLRAAIEEANVHSGADAVTFAAGINPANIGALNATTTPSSAIVDQLTIDGGGTTTVSFDPAADGPLLQATAAGTTVKGIGFSGGKSGPVVGLVGSGGKLDRVTVSNAPGDAIVVAGPDAVLTAPAVAGAAANAIVLNGTGAQVTDAELSGAKLAGIAANADGGNITGGHVHDNGADGVAIAAQAVRLTKVVIYGNAGKPVALAPGANGGVLPPDALRIGPRQADGSLPLTGTTPSGGSVELWSGTPFGPLAPVFADAFNVDPGTFTYKFATEPPPGATFAVTLTTGGTSEFSTVTVPGDVISPDIIRARALSTTDVRVFPSEPIDPASVQPGDFTLTMAGKDRTITAAAAAPDGTSLTLTSSGWKAGEAGYVTLTAAGALADQAGNASLSTTRLRVAAAPGDFVAPIGAELTLVPKSICLTHGRGCHSTGTKIRFVTTEPGKADVVFQRGDKRIGDRTYAVDPGLNTLKFNGRLGGRKLRAGRYRVLVYVQDQVGNVTDQPPIALMTVRRVSK